jgi:sialidase-1
MALSKRWLSVFLVVAIGWALSQAGSSAGQGHSTDSVFEESNLFVGGNGGYVCYRVPALAVSTKGTILAFCEARKHTGADWDAIDIALKRSFDNGKTWQKMQVVVGGREDTFNQPTPVVDRSTGTIWLPFCNKNQQVFVTESKDQGATWSKPVEITRQVTEPTWHYFGAGPGHGIQLRSGRLLIPAWVDAAGLVPGMAPGKTRPTARNDWVSPGDFDKAQFSYCFYSDDHGASWKRGTALESNMSDECEVVEAADGRVYMNMRSRQGKHRRAHAWSEDGGRTWSNVKYDETLPEPSCEGSLVRFTDRDRFGKNRVLLANPASTTDRSKLTVRVSYDECQTWPLSKIVHAGLGAEYSDLAIAPDMTILCLYDLMRPSNQQEYDETHHVVVGDDVRLVLARFNLAWLTNGKDHL